MPTENPKISAYVPQMVFDHLEKYKEERKISMSQAATEIFAHYFGLNLEESAKEFTGGLPGKLLQVEQSLKQLKDLYVELSAKVDLINTTGKPLKDNTVNNLVNGIEKSIPLSKPENSLSQKEEGLSVEVDQAKSTSRIPENNVEDILVNDTRDGVTLSEPQSSLSQKEEGLSVEVNQTQSTSRTPEDNAADISTNDTGYGVTLSEPQSSSSAEIGNEHNSSLLSELPVDSIKTDKLQMELSDILSELPSSLSIKISHQTLAKRLGVAERTLMNYKAKSNEVFAQWSASKDPDGTSWKSVKENRKVYYVPVGSLDSELQSKLLKLVEK